MYKGGKIFIFLFSLLGVFWLTPKALAEMPRNDFVDVASWNGNLSVSDFQNLKAQGVKGAAVKLSEGIFYLNPYSKVQTENARAAGMQVSAYHYAHYKNETEARNEADYFAREAKALGFGKNDLLISDLEEYNIPNKTVNTILFLDQLKKDGFTNLMVYTSGGWIDGKTIDVNAIGKNNIWAASYPYYPDNKQWYSEYAAWQWTSTKQFKNVYGNFDCSIDYTGKFTQNEQSNNSDTSQGSNDSNKNDYVLTEEKAIFTTNTAVNVRSKPSTVSDVVATYDPEESVYYDSYTVNDGYVWIHYISYSGSDRFMAVREQNKEAWGTFTDVYQHGGSYVVKSGDTLGTIAAYLGTSVSYLYNHNGISNPNLIYAGQTIYY
ncbi:GH25 family lysozyme [Enterococcus sp. DIV0240a]|uniref:GH25 family lysozyme n=1 Tax=Enterococcus sp. DIV0240a TaxID=2774651 RepID=UPI003D27706A